MVDPADDLSPQRLRDAFRHRALVPLSPILERLLIDGTPTVESLDRRLAELASVRFEHQAPRRRRRAPFALTQSYDGSITSRGAVPTRPGSLHDVMNAIAWAAFPASKRVLHARQAAELEREVPHGDIALPNRRSRLRDRLTMLDEGGVILWGAGRGRCASLFGHAIGEHLVRTPERDVRAAIVELDVGSAADVDVVLAEMLGSRSDAALEAWLGAFPSRLVSLLFAPP